jgi:antitoxin VapB
MALNIANPKVEEKAIQVARITGMNKTAAVEAALDYFLARHGKDAVRERNRGSLAKLLDDFASLPVLDSRSPDEIIGYDEHGLPK